MPKRKSLLGAGFSRFLQRRGLGIATRGASNISLSRNRDEKNDRELVDLQKRGLTCRSRWRPSSRAQVALDRPANAQRICCTHEEPGPPSKGSNALSTEIKRFAFILINQSSEVRDFLAWLGTRRMPERKTVTKRISLQAAKPVRQMATWA